jgi:hypothetical protein
MRLTKLQKTATRFAHTLGLPEASVCGGLILECNANREVVADGCTGVLEYTDQVIRLSSKEMVLRFCGDDLSIGAMEQGSLLVKGNIRSIEFLL